MIELERCVAGFKVWGVVGFTGLCLLPGLWVCLRQVVGMHIYKYVHLHIQITFP